MMTMHSKVRRFVEVRRLCDKGNLSFAVAICCLVAGAGGWLASRMSPGDTAFQGFLMVAAFYFLLGIANLWSGGTSSKRPHRATSEYTHHPRLVPHRLRKYNHSRP